jgi:hypothetical protein
MQRRRVKSFGEEVKMSRKERKEKKKMCVYGKEK